MGMLGCEIFSCTCKHVFGNVVSSALVFLTFIDSTLWDLLFYVTTSCNMGWGGVGPVTYSDVHVTLLAWGCYAARSSCAFF